MSSSTPNINDPLDEAVKVFADEFEDEVSEKGKTSEAHETPETSAASKTDEAVEDVQSQLEPEQNPSPEFSGSIRPIESPSRLQKFFSSSVGLISALFLSVFTIFVYHVRKDQTFGITTREERILTCIQIVIWFVTFLLLWKGLDLFDQKAADGDTPRPSSDGSGSPAKVKHFLFSWNPGSVIITALLLFALFLPYIIIFYPGVSSSDTVNQLKDYVTGTLPIEISWNTGEPKISCFLNDHHPVVDTLVFVFFEEYLGKIYGQMQGVFIYTCTQAVLTAVFMSLMLCRMEKMGVPYLYRKIGFLYLGLAPFIPLYVIGMLKDSLHSMFYIPYLLIYVLIIREGATRGRMILLLFLSLLLALTKKTGLYMILICNIPLILFPSVRKKLVGWAASWILPALILMFIMPHILFPMYNIFPGGKQEALGFSLQMTAQTYLDHHKELSPGETAIIGNVLDLSRLEEEYSYYNYDTSKKLFNFNATDQQLSEYKKLWLRLFLRYPKSGIKALFGTAGGFFSPTERIRVYYKYVDNNYITVTNPPEKESMRDLVKTAFNWLHDQHIIGILLECVLYAWWLPFAALMRILIKPSFKGQRFGYLMCLLPTAVCILILWASPYSMARYGLPIFYTIPLIMGLAATKVGSLLTPSD